MARTHVHDYAGVAARRQSAQTDLGRTRWRELTFMATPGRGVDWVAVESQSRAAFFGIICISHAASPASLASRIQPGADQEKEFSI